MRRRWETVLNAFEMPTAMVLPETTLAEMGGRAEAVECLGLKPCWERRVPSASTMDGRMSRSSIFTVGQSSEMGCRRGPALVASMPLGSE